METRRFGRTGHQTSVLVFGAASLGAASQEVAAASLAEARRAGINHLDTAASYGHAEEVMGPSMPALRADVFLATKSGERTAEKAWAEFNRSLERLQVDQVDLLQVHGVCDMAELDRVFAPGGCITAFERARAEGLTRFLGITGHTEAGPRVHAEALRRFDFDSVLTPLNFVLWQDAGFRAGYEELVELVRARDVGLRTIKAVARRPWGDREQRYSTWYEPFDEQRYVTAAISWVLNGHPEVTGIATAGETTLLRQAIEAEAHRMTVDDAERVLSSAPDYETIFVNA